METGHVHVNKILRSLFFVLAHNQEKQSTSSQLCGRGRGGSRASAGRAQAVLWKVENYQPSSRAGNLSKISSECGVETCGTPPLGVRTLSWNTGSLHRWKWASAALLLYHMVSEGQRTKHSPGLAGATWLWDGTPGLMSALFWALLLLMETRSLLDFLINSWIKLQACPLNSQIWGKFV